MNHIVFYINTDGIYKHLSHTVSHIYNTCTINFRINNHELQQQQVTVYGN